MIANLIFIPSYGAAGAAIGTIFAEASVAIYQTFKVRKELDIAKYFVNSLIYIIPAICMYLCIYLLKDFTESTIITLIVQVIIGGCVYVILTLILLCIVDKDLKKKIRNLSSKFRRE